MWSTPRSVIVSLMNRAALRIALLALVGCSTGASDGADAGAVDAGSPPPKACSRDARDLPRVDYFPTAPVAGACSAEDILIFGDDCGPDPSSKKCGGFLASSPTCARCLLGAVLSGPLRRNAQRLTEISPGACGQVLAGEMYGAAVDAVATPVGGCGQTMENVGACVDYACGACDAGDVACRVTAYHGQCSTIDPELPHCDAFDAGTCVLGTSVDRARAIAAAVCGGSAIDAGSDAMDAATDAADAGGD
jgi:hypothetical protein